jgi:hypothetical protein
MNKPLTPWKMQGALGFCYIAGQRFWHHFHGPLAGGGLKMIRDSDFLASVLKLLISPLPRP